MNVEQTCNIVDKQTVGGAVFMTLEVGTMVRASFRAPGQFVHIKCGDGLLLRRPISVCTCQEDCPDDLLSIVFEARGEGTRWLADRSVGDRLDVLGLAGNGYSMDPGGRYLLVGGGIGVPPLWGCAQYADGNSAAILGFRSAERAILVEQFESACSKILVATDDGTLGHHGFVDALVRQELALDRGYDAILACGPRPMLRSVARAWLGSG
ncbi:MAG: dihydroorotate dehydrogenase electron transfer subunit, partial [Lawsonibacter sp.]